MEDFEKIDLSPYDMNVVGYSNANDNIADDAGYILESLQKAYIELDRVKKEVKDLKDEIEMLYDELAGEDA